MEKNILCSFLRVIALDRGNLCCFVPRVRLINTIPTVGELDNHTPAAVWFVPFKMTAM